MFEFNPTSIVRMNMKGMSEDQFVAHAKKARYITAVVIDANRLAARLYNEAGVLYPISRIYPFEPMPNSNDPAHVKAYAARVYEDLKNLRRDAGSPNVLYYINNERGFDEKMFAMYTELMEISVKDPEGVIGMVFWNGSSGAVKTGFWGEPNEWASPWALKFIMTMHKYRNKRLPSGAYAFVLGVHNYTSQYPLIAVNAGRDRKTRNQSYNLWDQHNLYASGQKYVDWRLAQDHIGRDYQGIMKALGYVPSADGRKYIPTENTATNENGDLVFAPWMIGSEVGYDNMNDVRDVHRDELIAMAADEFIPMSLTEVKAVGAYGLRAVYYRLKAIIEWLALYLFVVGGIEAFGLDTPRGYRSLAKTWAQFTWFPGQPAGYVLGWTQRWNWRVILAPTGVFIGQTVFCEGQTSDQWVSYNVFGDKDYQAFAENALEPIPEHFIRVPSGQPPTPPPPPPADPLVERIARLEALASEAVYQSDAEDFATDAELRDYIKKADLKKAIDSATE